MAVTGPVSSNSQLLGGAPKWLGFKLVIRGGVSDGRGREPEVKERLGAPAFRSRAHRASLSLK